MRSQKFEKMKSDSSVYTFYKVPFSIQNSIKNFYG